MLKRFINTVEQARLSIENRGKLDAAEAERRAAEDVQAALGRSSPFSQGPTADKNGEGD